MIQYEYKFVEIPRTWIFSFSKRNDYENCKNVIFSETKKGWRFKQVVVPYRESIFDPKGYEIIFEKEISESERP